MFIYGGVPPGATCREKCLHSLLGSVVFSRLVTMGLQ